VGDKIFLTCYSGYGLDGSSPGAMEDLKRHVVCLQRGTGEIVWKKVFDPKLPESGYSGRNNMRHGYASSTIASDGKRLFVFFGKTGVYCLSLTGDQLWHSSVGQGTRGWGSANSPLLYQGLVIINASVESGSLIALDAKTGAESWSVDGMRSSWNTPALVEAPGGGTELVVSVPEWLLGFDPSSGKELWRCNGVPSGYVCPSVVSHEGVVYVTGGRGRQYTFAVLAGGRGDVSATHELWRVAKGSNVSSPLYHNGYLYVASDSRGIAFCFDAADGKIMYQERMSPTPGLIYSSPLLAGGNVYYPSQYAGTFVLAAQPQYKLVAHNVTEDDARTNACLVADDAQLLLRSDRFLYCIGQN
jgi:outer membrane protein assembly factor BamB